MSPGPDLWQTDLMPSTTSPLRGGHIEADVRHEQTPLG